jgi:hypothetical protein
VVRVLLELNDLTTVNNYRDVDITAWLRGCEFG